MKLGGRRSKLGSRRRLISLVAFAVAGLLLVVAACGGDDDQAAPAPAPAAEPEAPAEVPAPEPEPEPAPEPAPEPEPAPAPAEEPAEEPAEPANIAYLIGGLGNTFIDAQLDEAQKVAEARGHNLEVIADEWDPVKQLALIEDALASGQYDAMVIEALDGQSVCDVSLQVAEQMPVAVVTAPICGDDTLTEGTAVFSGRIDFDDGKTMAEIVHQALGDDGGKIAYISGPTVLQIVQDQANGLKEGLAEYPEIELVTEVDGAYDPAVSLTAAEDILQANPDLDLIVAGADNMAEPAATAIEGAGKTGEVLLVGYGGTEGAFKLIEEGSMFGTLMLLPRQEAGNAVTVLIDTLEGKPVEQTVFLTKDDPSFEGNGNIVTSANVGKLTAQWK